MRILPSGNHIMCASKNGQIILTARRFRTQEANRAYNRKDFNAFQQEIFNEEAPPKFNFMDSFNMLDYVDNNFTETKRQNTLDHYYSMAKKNQVFNEVNEEN